MAITKLVIENFKGIESETEIVLKPLNFFIGPNSSGKSTCIHALAALSQTVKLPNNFRPLLLDDEFAQVHLGRFIEVIHSRSYSDAITLGLHVDNVANMDRETRKDKPILKGAGKYRFKSTKRTQDIYLAASLHTLGDEVFAGEKYGVGHRLTRVSTGTKVVTTLRSGFTYENPSAMARISYDKSKEFGGMLAVQRAIDRNLLNVRYLGPFRQSPLRRYPTRGSLPREVGSEGEATITLLANEVVQSQNRKHIAQVTSWLKLLGLGNKLEVNRVATSDLFDVSIQLAGNKSFPLADLGYGVSQVLPVLTQCSFAEPGATLLFEQPEIHLHSIAARNLVKVFVETATKKGVTILAETHSPELIQQIQREIREGKLQRDQVAIYRVIRSEGCSKITELEIDNDSSIYDAWEKGLSIE